MNGWLLDTNVLSELRRPRPNKKVVAFIAAQPLDALFVSSVVFAEIRFGIELIADLHKRAALNDWLNLQLRPMFEGRVLPVLSPPDLSALLTGPNSPLLQLRRLRDGDLDRLNALFKKDGTPAQRAILDQYAQSQEQARQLSSLLLDNLSSISGTSRGDLNITAAVLLKMNVSPVVTMSYSWGGDNHSDPGLAMETNETVASVAAISNLYARLREFKLEDRVTFVAQSVFGRTLSRKVRSPDGRDHHGNHHCTVMIGSRLRGSVIGGLELVGLEYQAGAISSTTGQGGPGGDINFADTLSAMGKTLGAAVGVSRDVLDSQITQGRIVSAALNT